MKKFIKKAALMIPAVKKHYLNVQELRNQNEQLKANLHISQQTNLYISQLSQHIQNFNQHFQYQTMALESMLDDIYDSVSVNKKFCPLCRNEFSSYLPAGIAFLRKHALCPFCNSLERHRLLWLFFENPASLFSEKISADSIRLLHFAPESVLRDKFLAYSNVDYYPVDLDSSVQGIRDVIDIQNIKYQDEMFDVIIANHVLEHVPDDYAAMRELRRVLKKDGVAYINVPIFESLDATLENPEYDTPELRTKYYGQHDHVRAYGKDYTAKLENTGFKVEINDPREGIAKDELSRFGLIKDPMIFQRFGLGLIIDEIIFQCTL